VLAKELLKSVNIWRRYGQAFGGTIFIDHCVYSADVHAFCVQSKQTSESASVLQQGQCSHQADVEIPSPRPAQSYLNQQ